jgi:hypothetical protein
MKKTVIASVALAAALFVVSCQKETNPAQNVSGPMTISAVSEGLNTPTKTEMIFKYDVAWSANDKIYVKDASGNHDTFTLQNGVGTTKGNFKQDGQVTFTGEVQAYYPATMLEGGSSVWPASQTNDQTIPMYCKKTLSGAAEERMDFSSLGSVLQIVFNTTQENVTLKSIEIKDGSATLSGAFTVDTDGKAVITATDKAGITLDLGTGVALGKAANYFNIAIPSGNYQDLTLVFTATDGKKCTMTGGKVNIAYNAVGRLTLMGEKFKADVPDGALPGVFTVSNDDGQTTKQIYFSQGNLYWDGDSFEFETNQYDVQSSWSTSHVSHFFWSKDASVACAGTYSESGTTGTDVFFTNVDGFKVNVGGKEQSGWRTLSTKEWQYLFNNHIKKWVTVNSVNGYVIAPDDFSGELADTYADDAALAANNLVFLPAAGGRIGSYVFDVGGYGYCWSSSAYDENLAYRVFFYSSYVYPDDSDGRDYGSSVRLITESN